MKIEQSVIKRISSQVYQRFPEMDGSKPIIQLQRGIQAKSVAQEPTLVIMYQTNARNPKGINIPRRVRVVADQTGNILRISTSH